MIIPCGGNGVALGVDRPRRAFTPFGRIAGQYSSDDDCLLGLRPIS